MRIHQLGAKKQLQRTHQWHLDAKSLQAMTASEELRDIYIHSYFILNSTKQHDIRNIAAVLLKVPYLPYMCSQPVGQC